LGAKPEMSQENAGDALPVPVVRILLRFRREGSIGGEDSEKLVLLGLTQAGPHGARWLELP